MEQSTTLRIGLWENWSVASNS